MPDNPRIDELKRRVQKDPASIAFAQLAEEYRRRGENEEAIRVCRSGLAQHPGYLSARVTLGRALLDTGQFEDAENELAQVVRVAPDNLAAIRALADIHQRREDGGARPLEPSPAAPRDVGSMPDLDLAFTGTDDHFAEALRTLGATDAGFDLPDVDLNPPPLPVSAPIPFDPVAAELEAWLDAIAADRDARRADAGRQHAEGRPFTGRQS